LRFLRCTGYLAFFCLAMFINCTALLSCSIHLGFSLLHSSSDTVSLLLYLTLYSCTFSFALSFLHSSSLLMQFLLSILICARFTPVRSVLLVSHLSYFLLHNHSAVIPASHAKYLKRWSHYCQFWSFCKGCRLRSFQHKRVIVLVFAELGCFRRD
jgi:hypothetical protein